MTPTTVATGKSSNIGRSITGMRCAVRGNDHAATTRLRVFAALPMVVALLYGCVVGCDAQPGQQSTMQQLNGVHHGQHTLIPGTAGLNVVQFVEQFQNESAQPVYVSFSAPRYEVWQLGELKSNDQGQTLIPYPKPINPNLRYSVPVVIDVPWSGREMDLTVTVQPDEVTEIADGAFAVLEAGRYRLDSECEATFFDKPNGEFVKKVTLKASMEFDVEQTVLGFLPNAVPTSDDL